MRQIDVKVIRVNRLGKRLPRKTCESDIQIVRPGSDFPSRTPTRCEWKFREKIDIKILYVWLRKVIWYCGTLN